MTFPGILPHLAAGRKVRRDRWARGAYVEPPDGTTETVRVRPAIFGGTWLGLNLDDLLATDWDLVEEPAAITYCQDCNCDHHAEIAEDRATIAGLHSTITDLKQGIDGRDATITRLTQELDEAKAAKPQRPSLLALAARAFAHERLWDGDVKVDCSIIDYLRAGYTGMCLKIPVQMRDNEDPVAVYLQPTSELGESELRFSK